MRWRIHWTALGKVRHYLLSAIALASALLILDYHGFTNWLDSLALRIAVAAKGPGTAARPDSPSIATTAEGTVVLAIGPRFYEAAFGQASPLDRAVLATLLDEVRRGKPSALVIDLDVSPVAGSGDPAADPLDAAIVAFVRAGIPVTVATPAPVVTREAFTAKFEWMARLCGAGVGFGYPDLLQSQGVVLRLDPAFPGIAVVAANASERAWAVPAGYTADYEPCRLVESGPGSAVFLDAAFSATEVAAVTKFAAQVPIDTDFLLPGGLVYTQLDGPVAISSAVSLAGRTVFLGGNYDPGDVARSAVGEVPGVRLHAAGYESLFSRPSRAMRAVAIGFDMLLGVLSGLAFSFGWARYNRRARAMAAGDRRELRNFVAAKAWLVANFAVLAIFVAAIFVFSAWLLQRNLWNNPAGMLIGVFLDALVGSREDALEQGSGPPGGGPPDGAGRGTSNIGTRLSRLLMLPLIAWAAWLFLRG